MSPSRPASGRAEHWSFERLDALADRVRASPEVVRLHTGMTGEIAAHLPGARVPGIRLIGDDRLEVHVVMSLHSTVDRVESSVLDAAGDDRGRIDVVIDDIVDPDADASDADDPDAVDQDAGEADDVRTPTTRIGAAPPGGPDRSG